MKLIRSLIDFFLSFDDTFKDSIRGKKLIEKSKRSLDELVLIAINSNHSSSDTRVFAQFTV